MPDNLLPAGLALIAQPVWGIVLALAVYQAPWRTLLANRLQPLFAGTVVGLILLWDLKAGITPGLSFHFLGVTVFTLMFGWSFAVIGVSLAVVGTLVIGEYGLQSLGFNGLLVGVLPVSVSYGIYYAVHRYLPRHVFIYIFLCAFFGSIMAAGITLCMVVVILVVTETYTLSRITEEYLPFLPLYLFPEGVLNGMLTTVFVGLRPQWLKTFDDETYLKPW